MAMPVEIIGEFGTPGASREWLSAQATLAIRHIIKTCGPPPPEMELEVQWQEHELGSYPLIVLTWEDAMRGAPGNYLARCEVALVAYENGGELPPGWTMPPVVSEDEDPNEPVDPDEPLPEPPESLNVLEYQQYISKSVQWAFEASKRERSRPHLVERDDDDKEAGAGELPTAPELDWPNQSADSAENSMNSPVVDPEEVKKTLKRAKDILAKYK